MRQINVSVEDAVYAEVKAAVGLSGMTMKRWISRAVAEQSKRERREREVLTATDRHNTTAHRYVPLAEEA